MASAILSRGVSGDMDGVEERRRVRKVTPESTDCFRTEAVAQMVQCTRKVICAPPRVCQTTVHYCEYFNCSQKVLKGHE